MAPSRMRGALLNVVVDTNFIVQLGEGSITLTMLEDAIVSSYRLVVPRGVLDEAERLSKRAGKAVSRRAARGLEIIRRAGFAVAEHSRGIPADKAVIEVAYRLKREGVRVIVATSDREVRRTLKSIGIPTIYFRESERLLEADWLPP